MKIKIAGEEKPLFGKHFFKVMGAFAFLGLCVYLVDPPLSANKFGKGFTFKADMRSIATAIESYLVDNYRYPPSNPKNLGVPYLTTPVAYLTSSSLRDRFKAPDYKCIKSSPSYLFKRFYPEELPFPILTIILILVGFYAVVSEHQSWEKRDKLGEACRLGLPFLVIAFGWIVWLFADKIKDGPPPGLRVCGPGEVPMNWPGERPPFHYYNVISDPDSELSDGVRSHSWVLVSVGPDGDLDLDFADLEDTSYSGSSFYDPSNGTLSSGDIIRTGKGQLN